MSEAINSNLGPMMTLAGLAATGANERPSGETLEQQEQRILAGINAQLANSGLATQGNWQAVWLGLSQDRANLAFIAQNISSNALAVSIRGTQFNSLIDLGEDMAVGSISPFTAAFPAGNPGNNPLMVSRGSMEAFTEMMASIYIPARTNLMQALAALVSNAASGPTLYVTGHSLGGAMATMIALYLAAQPAAAWGGTAPALAVYTFAAPTAGLSAFASYYDQIFPSNAWRVYNVWDVVPNAWASMGNVEGGDNPAGDFYPSPGPAATLTVTELINNFIMDMYGDYVYVQTNGGVTPNQNAIPLNGVVTYGDAGSFYDPASTCPTTADFFGQVAYQHANNTYLGLLQTMAGESTWTLPNMTPAVISISPDAGSAQGGTLVTITGSGFTPDSAVDFGTVPAIAATINSATQISAIAPPGAGTCNVRVTNMFGTSAGSPACQFAAPAPVLPTAIASISPACGPVPVPSLPNGLPAYTVTLTGSGLTSPCTVEFGDVQTTDVAAALTQMTAVPPGSGTGTVSITVKTATGTATSPTQFTFGPPVVTGMLPCCGPGGTSDFQVTINGAGFANGCSVNFQYQYGSNIKNEPGANVTYISALQITCDAPKVLVGSGTSVVASVTVTVNGETSDGTTPASQFTFYPS
jgi:hypothetical protein